MKLSRKTILSLNLLVPDSKKHFLFLDSLEDNKSYTFCSNSVKLRKKWNTHKKLVSFVMGRNVKEKAFFLEFKVHIWY